MLPRELLHHIFSFVYPHEHVYTTETADRDGSREREGEYTKLLQAVPRKNHNVTPPDVEKERERWTEIREAHRLRLVCGEWHDLFDGQHYETCTLTLNQEHKVEQVLFKWRGLYYLELKNHENNFSQYVIPTRGGWNAGDSNVTTKFFKIRFDPKSLKVDTGDFTFSQSVGICHHHSQNVDSVPFGTCFGCEAPACADSKASIDLCGTVLCVAEHFHHSGYISAGNCTKMFHDQVVKLQGGGYCGWMAPAPIYTNEGGAAVGGWHIQLALVAGAVE